MRRNKIIFSIFSFAAIFGLGGFLYQKNASPFNGLIQPKTSDSATISAYEIAKQCDIFNQTDAEILAQSPDAKDCYFTGCGGFF